MRESAAAPDVAARRVGAPVAVIQSLGRGLGLLERVAARANGVALAELSREVGLHPSTVFHLLRTLVALGYLTQDEGTRAYRLGGKVFQLAGSAWTEAHLAEKAAPLLAELALSWRETSHLAVHEHGRAILIAKVDGSGPLRVSERIGTPRPLHCTAIGKVLLAALPEAEARAVLGRERLTRYTERTLTDRVALDRELARVRAEGWALDDEEFSDGVRCLAAPARNFTGRVVAALGVSGPVTRLTRPRIAELASRVAETANRLSREFGWDGVAGRPGSAVRPARRRSS